MGTGKRRLLLIDGIRGFAIVNMVLFHFLYDVFMVYRINTQWYQHPLTHLWQQMICWTFIFISGTTWRMGRRKLKRGIILNLWGLVITVVTLLFMPDQAIWFGILNFIGCAYLIMIPLSKILEKIPTGLGMAVSLGCFFLFQNISQGYLGVGSRILVLLPQELYKAKIFTILGMPFPGFYSSDYFPVFPWLFLFILGYYFSMILEKRQSLRQRFYPPIPVLTKIGQKSLMIYVLHQPVCMAVCMAFLYWMGQ